MEGFIQRQTVDLEGINPVLIRDQPIVKGDAQALTWIVTVRKGGESVDLSGAEISLYCARALDETADESGGTTYSSATGTSNGVVTAKLPQDAANIPGAVGCTIRAALNGASVTLARMAVIAIDPIGSDILDEGKRIPNLDDVLAAVTRCEKAAKAAEDATASVNSALTSAGKATEAANTAASTANASAKTANASAAAADKATASANAAAGKIDGMTVAASGLPAGSPPTAKLTEESGHYKLTFGLTKGDTGASGVYTGPDEPTDPDIDVWINPDGTPTDVELLAARQNILTGSANGNPASVADAFAAPLCGLHIYGRSRQNGTPSADNPAPIIAAGADGTLQVKITGTNLLNFEKIRKENANVEFAFENDILTITAPNKQGYAGISIPLPDECAGKTIFFKRTIDSNPNKLKSIIQMRYTLNGKNVYFSNANTVKIPEGASSIIYNIMARNENTAAEGTITVQYPVVCYGDKLLPYEPYHEQAITVQTSGGLHGIPVSSGGNYTDADGQQWVCDEIDLAQGKIIRRVNADALDTTKALSEQSGFEMEPVEFPLSSEEIAAYKALTAYAQTTVVQAKNVAGIRLDYQRDVNRVIKKLEDALAAATAS